MADLSDVLNALVNLAEGVFYPNPPASGNSTVTGTPVKIYPGWPIPDQLNADLPTKDAGGNPRVPTINISVFAMPGGLENVTRYPEEWIDTGPASPPTITVTTSGKQATIGGTVSTPQNVALIVDGLPYVYPVQSNDTLSSIATALAALVSVDQLATANGAVITIPGSHSIIGRVGGFGNAVQELMRVKQRFMISFWCPTPALRDTASSPIKLAIAQTKFLTLPDNFAARMIFAGDSYTDEREKLLIYRRDLIVSVEYATTDAESVPQIIVPQVQLTSNPAQQTLETEDQTEEIETESGQGLALEDPTFIEKNF